MILELTGKSKKRMTSFMLALLYFEIVLPPYVQARSSRFLNPPRIVTENGYRAVSVAKTPATTLDTKMKKSVKKTALSPDIGGPTQPESQAFHSVNNENMVDLFSGDFSYNIPLMDVGGYPVAIGYNSGISMDQEASWVGLGWNINPGTITRNLRGIPDDFNGTDTIQKTASIKDNKSTGVTAGANLEVFGLPKEERQAGNEFSVNVGASIGVTHNSYKGWGLETGTNASISAGAKSMGTFTSGLSFTNSSQDGISVGTSLDYRMNDAAAAENNSLPAGSISTGLSYNTRSGLKALQFTAGLRQYGESLKNRNQSGSIGSVFSSYISFAHPSFTPTITLPYTSSLFSFTAKVGGVVKGIHGSLFVSGYMSKQGIAAGDKRQALPAYGYLNYQQANGNEGALLDFNREKDMAYREKPAVPNIAIPSYTYDVFSMSGEGTGGMFRAYRGDIGYVHDHRMKTKDLSGRFSGDLGLGDVGHWGVDLNVNRSYTQTGPWKETNPLANTVAFRKSDRTFEAAYFRNPGEKAVNAKAFYDNIGGDDVVAVNLFQANNSSPYISTTHLLNRYRNKSYVDQQLLSPGNVYKTTRDKRTQVISYLTAEEASVAGLSKYIENYKLNEYSLHDCDFNFPDELGEDRHGLWGEYFGGKNFERFLYSKTDTLINFANVTQINVGRPANVGGLGHTFSVRWTGRLKADVTGAYQILTRSDDGVRLYINDSLFINRWNDHPNTPDTAFVNMVAGELYNIRLEYYQAKEGVVMQLHWRYGGLPLMPIPRKNLYLMPVKDTFLVGNGALSREKRVNDFRKKHHISEIDVVNPDGRRYVYGIPVYNLKQKEVTFSVDAARGNSQEGLVKYTAGSENTIDNNKGNDHYFNSEEMPAYAHSFLLTGLMSPDYVDLTGDGISDDDPGDAVKFNYTKVSGIKNPYRWRAPYKDSATYNEGLKTDNRDDKGSYVYGEKELWYLNSIASKNMIATFKLSDRDDQPAIDENGNKFSGGITKKLDEINLYIKADFEKYGAGARPVKTIHFEYTYELCAGISKPINNGGKLTLKKIWFTYNGNKKGMRNPYVFNYNSNNPAYNVKSYDRWGNYKDALQNPGSSAGNVISNAEYPYALQDSTLAAQNAAAWTLDSIVLPSGSRIKVDYESDDYAYVQNKRAAQMFKIAGFSAGKPSSLSDLNAKLYGLTDYLYVSVNVPKAVSSNKEVFTRYLEGADTLFFRLYVKMPSDKFGSGHEYVSCYATMEPGTYGYFNGGQTIWLKLKGITQSGDTDKLLSVYSPLAKAAIQFLRLNLPSKAYPGSDVGDDIDVGDAVKVLLSQASNLLEMIQSYDNTARIKGWANQLDLSRSMVRLNNPYYKKYGGGLRVKRVRIYDHWNAMTKQKESVYGHEYQYTTLSKVNGVEEVISSGVASYEPTIGGEENPWRLPIVYKEQVAALAPISMGYTEKPLGETFYPAPSVGYSKVRTRTIHAKNTRSANGYEEAGFYTTYDFPTLTDMTLLADSKKRFKPTLSNFLRINARHFVAVSQGFKVELNDMNGKQRSHASFSEADADIPISFTEYYYKVDDPQARFKHLNNSVMVISPQGIIDTTASMGKDVELMMDMREQRSVTNAVNLNLNGDSFTFPMPPIFLIPTLWSLAQREETLFRSVGTTKIINRHGIMDSVVVIERGSKLSTKNLLFDGETGDVVLTRTQNEFDDPVYKFSIPSGWTYDGMSGAYKNINVKLDNVYINQGRITSGLSPAIATDYFAPGDEILIGSRQKTGGTDCEPDIATFRASGMAYAVDANALSGGTPDIYFVDRDGTPFTGNDVSMNVIRSGRRNISTAVGEVTSLENPMVKNAAGYSIVLDNTRRALSASAVEYKQFWKTADKNKIKQVVNCLQVPYNEYAGANDCGNYYYSNNEVSRVYSINCGRGYAPAENVRYVVPEGSYSSDISQTDADEKAAADLFINGQEYADAHAICRPYYYSVAIDKDYTKNDCSTGGIGSVVTYHHPAATDSSLVSQAAADTLGMARANIAGQANANSNGYCTYYNQQQSGVLNKNNCPPGSTGSVVAYTIAAGLYQSTISLADANAQAMVAAQDEVNARGNCIWSSQAINAPFTRNNCPGGVSGSTVTYSAAAGAFTSDISQADADAKANTAGQEYANIHGVCTVNATITLMCSDRGCTEQGGTSIRFVFPTPTTVPITLLLGEVRSTINGKFYVGSDIFTPPAGAQSGAVDAYAPYIVTIPAGVTSYTTSGNIFQQGFGDGLHSWICHSCQFPIVDLYVKSITEGAMTNFTITNANTAIHNIQ
jgi:hypothetical protein